MLAKEISVRKDVLTPPVSFGADLVGRACPDGKDRQCAWLTHGAHFSDFLENGRFATQMLLVWKQSLE